MTMAMRRSRGAARVRGSSGGCGTRRGPARTASVAGAVGVDVGVDAVGVGLELVELVGGKDGDGAVGGGAELEEALLAVVVDEGGAEDFGEGAGAVAAEGVHLEEAVGGGDVALGEEQVVEVGGVEGGDALGVAGDGDGGGEAGDGDGAVEEALVGEEVGAHVAAEGGGDDARARKSRASRMLKVKATRASQRLRRWALGRGRRRGPRGRREMGVGVVG